MYPRDKKFGRRLLEMYYVNEVRRMIQIESWSISVFRDKKFNNSSHGTTTNELGVASDHNFQYMQT